MCTHVPITVTTVKVQMQIHNYASRNICMSSKYDPKIVESVEGLLHELCTLKLELCLIIFYQDPVAARSKA